MPLSPELVEAYRRTDYAVCLEPDLVFHVDEPNQALDLLLVAHGAGTAAFITASNPRGRVKSAAENQRANAELYERQTAAGYLCYPGEGRGPDGKWREESFLILQISRADAEALGRTLNQNAIVFIEHGHAPELIVL
jgi:Protein of unknown function (DUF3293)